MTNAMTQKAIALKDLSLHESNVRAQSAETYETDNIAHLKASILALGLIQPIVVQVTKTGFGVLAGGRRLAALKELASDKTKATKAFAQNTKIDCRVVPDGCDVVTAISLAENITQAQMTPIDEFEAFAQMMTVDGQTPQTIALTFGTSVAAVKERLRYGMVHPQIRSAVRSRDLSLDAMKAFAGHPCQEAQAEIFQALQANDDHIGAYQVRRALEERGVQATDKLGAFVVDEYKAQDGKIATDLLEDNALLEDRALVDAILTDQLQAIADAERDAAGFGWADVMIAHDYQVLHKYGRIYPGPVEVDAATQAKIDEIVKQGAALEEKVENGGLTDQEEDKLYDQIEDLGEQADALQNGYDPDDLKRAGVIVSWQNGVTITRGLVRPEDTQTAKAKDTSQDDGTITYSAKLADDLRTERGMALAAGLASNPEVASDLALFKIICDVMLQSLAVTRAFAVSATQHYGTHACEDTIDQTAITAMEKLLEDLDTSWLVDDIDDVARFARFRVLDAAAKAKLTAYAMAQTVQPCFARGGHTETLMGAIEAEVMPDLRVYWKPNAALFKRMKKAHLIGIIKDLGLIEEAMNLASKANKDIVAFLDALFTEPFATLTDAQRAAVDSWCPPSMQTAPAGKLATAAMPKPRKKAV